jgi:hypothetical protein
MADYKYFQIVEWEDGTGELILYHKNFDSFKIYEGKIAYVNLVAERAERIIEEIVKKHAYDAHRIVGYHIYCSIDKDLPKERWERITYQPIFTPDFIADRAAEPGVQYYYYSRSVNGLGVEGEPSEVIAPEPLPLTATDKEM